MSQLISPETSSPEVAEQRLMFPLAVSSLEEPMKRDRLNSILIVLVNILWIGLSLYNADLMWAAILILALFFTAPKVWRASARLRSLQTECIWVDHDTLFLPLATTETASEGIPINRLTLVDQRLPDDGDAGGLLLGTQDKTFGIQAELLDEPSRLPLLTSVLVERICQEPGGRERLVNGRELEREHRYRYGRRPRVTFGLAIAILLVHFIQLGTGAISQNILGGDPFELIRLGANVPFMLLDGAWERAVTATFMHGGWVHLIMNGVALLALGGIVENTLGSRRMVVVYGLSALAASYASAVWSGALLSVGASGAIFGLLGALAVIQWRHRRVLAPRFRQSRRWWIIILLINGVLPVLIPQIDFVAHGVGMVVGAGLTLWVAPRGSLDDPDAPAPWWVSVITGGLIVMTSLAVGVQVAGYPSADDPALSFLRRAPMETPQQRESLNAMAWTLAIARDVTSERLVASRDMMERLVAEDQIPAFRDTLATLWFRTGHPEKAALMERAVLVDSDRRFMASQVLRFLVEAERGDGVKGRGLLDYKQRTVTIEDAVSIPANQVRFWGVFNGEQPFGLLRGRGPLSQGPVPVAGDALDEGELTFIPLGDFERLEGEGTPPVRFWKYDPEVDELPPKVRRPRR